MLGYYDMILINQTEHYMSEEKKTLYLTYTTSSDAPEKVKIKCNAEMLGGAAEMMRKILTEQNIPFEETLDGGRSSRPEFIVANDSKTLQKFVAAYAKENDGRDVELRDEYQFWDKPALATTKPTLEQSIVKAAGTDKKLDAAELQSLIDSNTQREIKMAGQILAINGAATKDSLMIGDKIIDLSSISITLDDKTIPQDIPKIFKPSEKGVSR